MKETTTHGSALEFEGKGLLIVGPSGSGKTSTLLEILEHGRISGRKARLVADDRVKLECRDGTLIASAPCVLRGLVEVYGLGIIKLDHVAEAPIKLVGSLVEHIERMPEPQTIELEGVSLPLINLPAGHEMRARRVLIQALEGLCA